MQGAGVQWAVQDAPSLFPSLKHPPPTTGDSLVGLGGPPSATPEQDKLATVSIQPIAKQMKVKTVPTTLLWPSPTGDTKVTKIGVAERLFRQVCKQSGLSNEAIDALVMAAMDRNY